MPISKISNFFKNKNRNYVIIAQVINAVILLLTGKLIAIYISPEDFGTYNIQWAAFTFFSALFIGPFVQYMKATNSSLLPKVGTQPYIITISIILVFAYCFLMLFLTLYYGFIDYLLFAILLVVLPLYTFYNVIGNTLNINNKLILFSQHTVLKSIGALLFLVVYFKLGFTFLNHAQVLWSMQLLGPLIGILVFFKQYRTYKPVVKYLYLTFLKKYFHFTGPLMFLALWYWVNNYFDRFAIEYFLSLNEVGIYNASYSVGSKFFLVTSPVFMILLNPFIFSNKKTIVKKKMVEKYSLYYSLLAIPILIIIYFTKDIIGILLLSEVYEPGFSIIFWVALAFFILTLSQLFELLFYAEKKTKNILYGYIISAFVNIILNIILIPIFDILGAAIATCIGYFVYFIFICFNFKKL